MKKKRALLRKQGKLAVTIATNMAGRGTDIKRSKDFIFEGKKEDETLIKQNEKKVKELGVYLL